jgi:P-type conjugative transfer ATPase TrbB
LNCSLVENPESVNQGNTRSLRKLFAELGKIGELMVSDSEQHPEDLVLDLDGTVRIKCGDGRFVPYTDLAQTQARRIVDTVAAMSDEVVTREKPVLQTDLVLGPYRYRFTATIPPLTERVVFAIRFAARRLYRLADYEAAGMADERSIAAIRTAINERQNILIAGGADSGKTTFANACLLHIAENCPARVVIIEDTRELQFPESLGVSLCASADESMRDCLRIALRMAPDRIAVGEVRGGEAYDLMKAWNTGHPGGVATVHANSARSALYRMEELISEVMVAPARGLIGRTIGLIVFLTGSGKHRLVKEVARPRLVDGDFAVEPI